MRTLKQADIFTGAFLAILGAATVVASTGIKGVAGETLDPRTLPTIVGWALVALGLGIVSIGARYQGEAKYISWPTKQGVLRIAINIVALIVYFSALEPLGFPISTGIYSAILFWYLGRYRVWIAALGGLATGAVIYFVFMELLGLNFPLGLLELIY